MTGINDRRDATVLPSARELLDRGAIGMCVLSLDGYHLHVNRTFCDMVARTHDELQGLSWTDLVDPESLARAGDWRSALEHYGRWRAELRMKRADGSLVPVLSIISRIRNEEGQAPYLFKQTMDLTDFEGLRKSLTGARAIADSVLAALEQLGEGVMILDPSTVLPVYVNDPILQMTGYTREELETIPGGLLSALRPDQGAELQDRFRRRMRGENMPKRHEIEVQRRDGSVVTIEYAVQLIPNEGNLLFVIARDVTKRKAVEEHLQSVGRIEAMGHLAAGTAHDFNNILTSVLGEADLLAEALEQDPAVIDWGEIRKGITDLRKTAKLGASLAKQLLNIGAPRTVAPMAIDVTEVVEKIEPVLRRILPDSVRLETQISDEACTALLCLNELEQILINLVLNAGDAMGDGGTIRISTSCVSVGSDATPHPLADNNDVILVTITDNGAGMPREVEKRIFEPFFTTKSGGGGTGLGLSVVDAIVTRAGGTISVDTEPGRGTSVTVRLPAFS